MLMRAGAWFGPKPFFHSTILKTALITIAVGPINHDVSSSWTISLNPIAEHSVWNRKPIIGSFFFLLFFFLFVVVVVFVVIPRRRHGPRSLRCTTDFVKSHQRGQGMWYNVNHNLFPWSLVINWPTLKVIRSIIIWKHVKAVKHYDFDLQHFTWFTVLQWLRSSVTGHTSNDQRLRILQFWNS